MQNLSPVGAYIWSAASVSDADGIKMAEVLKAAACMMAVTALSLELYRLRPSEAAGKPWHFQKARLRFVSFWYFLEEWREDGFLDAAKPGEMGAVWNGSRDSPCALHG